MDRRPPPLNIWLHGIPPAPPGVDPHDNPLVQENIRVMERIRDQFPPGTIVHGVFTPNGPIQIVHALPEDHANPHRGARQQRRPPTPGPARPRTPPGAEPPFIPPLPPGVALPNGAHPFQWHEPEFHRHLHRLFPNRPVVQHHRQDAGPPPLVQAGNLGGIPNAGHLHQRPPHPHAGNVGGMNAFPNHPPQQGMPLIPQFPNVGPAGGIGGLMFPDPQEPHILRGVQPPPLPVNAGNIGGIGGLNMFANQQEPHILRGVQPPPLPVDGGNVGGIGGLNMFPNPQEPHILRGVQPPPLPVNAGNVGGIGGFNLFPNQQEPHVLRGVQPPPLPVDGGNVGGIGGFNMMGPQLPNAAPAGGIGGHPMFAGGPRPPDMADTFVPNSFHRYLWVYPHFNPNDTTGRMNFPGIQWDIVYPPWPTARFFGHENAQSDYIQEILNAHAFHPTSNRVVELVSTNVVLNYWSARERWGPIVVGGGPGPTRVGDVLSAIFNYFRQPLTREEIVWICGTPSNDRRLQDAFRIRTTELNQLRATYPHLINAGLLAPWAHENQFLRSDVMGGHRRFFGCRHIRDGEVVRASAEFIPGPIFLNTWLRDLV